MTQKFPVSPRGLLPLSPQQFHILLSLAVQDRHGYGIILDVASRTADELRMGTGTLYTAIGRLVTLGLMEDTGVDDGRRRHYRLTRLGRAVLEAEAARLEALLRLARDEGIGGQARKPQRSRS
ncbi:MAG: helix-turn-helix transcriptional regulator [Vicinamibacterales bacterium]